MINIMNLQQKQILTAVILILSALTFFLPKEVFDPHIGIDVDIFCKSMSNFASDVVITEIFDNETVTSIIKKQNVDKISSASFSKRITIRAPPCKLH